MTQWLLDHGANPNEVKDYQGKSPLEVAQEAGHDAIIQLLQ